MKPIKPMTVEEFFAKTEKAAQREGYDGRYLKIFLDDEGGYRCDARSTCSYGDTPGEAIRAAFDHYMGNPSKRARMNPPYFTSDREALRWDKMHRLSYDYRAKDWEPPK